jgi:hypothetical protein
MSVRRSKRPKTLGNIDGKTSQYHRAWKEWAHTSLTYDVQLEMNVYEAATIFAHCALEEIFTFESMVGIFILSCAVANTVCMRSEPV